MSAAPLSIEALAAKTGQELGVSDWVEVTQEMINGFAEATGDHQYIHVDPIRAAKSPFGGTIAHGFLTLSLLSLMAASGMPHVAGAVMGVNYGLNRVRFTAPVPAGARLRARFTLAALDQGADHVAMTWNVLVEMEGTERPAMTAQWINRRYLDAAPE